jgi:hypothetical protein
MVIILPYLGRPLKIVTGLLTFAVYDHHTSEYVSFSCFLKLIFIKADFESYEELGMGLSEGECHLITGSVIRFVGGLDLLGETLNFNRLSESALARLW